MNVLQKQRLDEKSSETWNRELLLPIQFTHNSRDINHLPLPYEIIRYAVPKIILNLYK